MFGAVLNRLATSVRRALSKYAVGTQEPELAFDFIDNKYITNNSTSSFSSAITHARAGNATMTDGYGPELVVNGSFDSDSDWTKGTGWSIADGVASFPSGTASNLAQSGILTVGKVYEISFNVVSIGSGILNYYVGTSAASGNVSTTGYVTTLVEATANTNLAFRPGTGATGISIDNVSVREMPVLKWAPHNLALYSEQFDNAVWAKIRATVSANQIAAPNGTTTADKVIETAETGNHFIVDSSSVSFSVGQIGTSAVFLKAGERSAAVLQITDPSSPSRTRLQAIVDLSAGTITTQEFNTPTNTASSITDAGNGWYLVKLSMATKAAGPMECLFGPLDSTSYTTNLPSYTGDGSSGIYAWGAHIFRSDLGGMVDNPERGDSYVPTAVRFTGSNLITNGTFDTDTTGWSAYNAVISVSSQQLVVDDTANAGSDSQAYQDITTEVGQAYELSFDKISTTSAFWFSIGPSPAYSGIYYSGSLGTTTGRQTHTFVASSTLTRIALITSSTGVTVYDNVVVRKTSVRPDTARYLPRIGHHVYNGSAWVNEGVLVESEARTNLLTQSNALTSSPWLASNSSILVSSVITPDGTDNSFKLNDNTVNDEHSRYISYTYTTGLVYTLSIFAKKEELDFLTLGTLNNASQLSIFNLDTGVVDTIASDHDTATIEDVGNGWFRCSTTFTKSASINNFAIFGVSNASGTVNYAGNGSSGIYVYGAMLEQAATPSSYTPTSGATVTRAAETFTIPSANLPWPTPQYIGSELVTNGTFDTDSDWEKSSHWTISGGEASHPSSGTYYPLQQQLSLTASKVYKITLDITSITSGTLAVYLRNPAVSSTELAQFTTTGSKTIIFVANATEDYLAIHRYSGTTLEATIDNISVREINPLSVSIGMEGRMTYADTGVGSEVRFNRWYADSNNYIITDYATDGGNDRLKFEQRASGTIDNVQNSTAPFSPDILVPYNIASRHGSTFVNGAADGVALTANTTPTALPDLSSTDLSLAYDYMGTISEFRVWDKDLGDAGLVEATNPSLEPSLSLTFEGVGTNSFVVNDWSE